MATGVVAKVGWGYRLTFMLIVMSTSGVRRQNEHIF